MPTYSVATNHTKSITDELMEMFYPDLIEAQAKIGTLFAYATINEEGEQTAPAITHNGRPALYKIKVNNEAARLQGEPDATIFIDYAEWKAQMEDSENPEVIRAGLDEMLYSLVVKRDKEFNTVLTDDHGRPKMKLKKADYHISGFRAIAERHKSKSYEVRQARELHDQYGNILFNWADDLAVEVQGELDGVEVTQKPKRQKGAAVAAASRR